MRILFTLLLSLTSLFAAFGQTAERSQGTPEFAGVHAIQVYPSPADEYVYVSLKALMAQDVKITVHNIIGNEMRVETDVVGEHELRVNVKDLPSGFYLLTVKDEGTKFRDARKFLKRDQI